MKARNLLIDLVYYGRSRLDDSNAVEVQSTVAKLVSGAAGDIQMAAEIKGTIIDISTDNNTGFIRADPVAARVVVRNVLQNSLKYSRPGKTIKIAVQKVNDRVGITISDQGAGMSQEQLNRVREGQLVQSRTGSSGEKGTGTGLRLVWSICRSQGWNMEIESVADEGTTTTVWFPTAALSSPTDLPPQH